MLETWLEININATKKRLIEALDLPAVHVIATTTISTHTITAHYIPIILSEDVEANGFIANNTSEDCAYIHTAQLTNEGMHSCILIL